MASRGIRNHNPGNLRDTAAPWEGVAGTDGAFEIFKAPWWGIRALAKTLLTYQRKYDLRTIGELIHRWAPPSENDTDSYITHVSEHVGVPRNSRIDLEDYGTLRKLVEVIIEHENGEQPYTWEIKTGLILAGVEPKPKAVA